MMTPSGFMKPKLGFSIESLVGDQAAPSPSDSSREGTDSPHDDSLRSPSPVHLGSLFPRSLLNLQEKHPVIQRPQPINGATHRTASTADGDLQLPAFFQAAKGFGGFPNPLLPHPLGLASFPQLQGISIPPSLNPLMMGTAGIPCLGASSASREYPLYPWLLSRHGRIFPQGLPSPEQLAYLLQPFRRPKRIRTAFSPSQLLKLEQSFEKNQYVVGAERKQLAHNLNLSETQVKVWFQNRRTKEKRIHQDEDGDQGQGINKINETEEEEDDDEDEEEEDMDESTKKVIEEKGQVEMKRMDDRTSSREDDEEANKRRKIYEDGGSRNNIISSSLFSSSLSSSHSSDPFTSSSCPTAPIFFSTTSPSTSASVSSLSSSSTTSSNLSTLPIDSVILAKAIIGQNKNAFPNILSDENLQRADLRTKNVETVN